MGATDNILGTNERSIMGEHKIRIYNTEYADVIPVGLELPSVTSITGLLAKPMLYRWWGKHGNTKASQILKEAGELGTFTHDYAYGYFKDGEHKALAGKRPINNQPVQNFHKFIQQYPLEPVLLEQVVYDKLYQYAGTLDGVFRYDNKLILADWKISSFIGKDYEMQLSAYWTALQSMVISGIIKLDGAIEEGWIVRLPKDRVFDAKEDIVKLSIGDLTKAFDGFLGLLNVYNYISWRDKQCQK